MACILHTEGNTLMNCNKMREKKKLRHLIPKILIKKKNSILQKQKSKTKQFLTRAKSK